MTKKEVREQIDLVTKEERKWADHLTKQDGGSYCESPSREYTRARKTWNAWRKLLTELLDYEGQI